MKNSRVLKLYGMSMDDVDTLVGFTIGFGKTATIENDDTMKFKKEMPRERSARSKLISKKNHARKMHRQKQREQELKEISLLSMEEEVKEETEEKIEPTVYTLPKNMVFEVLEVKDSTPSKSQFNLVKEF